MKITESKLRKMIRSVIREFQTTTTVRGAKPKGYQSKSRKSAQSDYDTKSADYDAKDADYQTKRNDAATTQTDLDNFANRKYKALSKGGAVTYSSGNTGPRPMGYGPWALNPDWTTKNNANLAAQTAKSTALTAVNTAQTAKTSALSTLDTRKASDLEKEKQPTSQKQPTGGGKGGTGKAKGKGKGGKKGKKKKN